ncbi:MAG: cell wall hydrolase [Tabrizicola sp.]|nr:cell wall hydrolase [Tabrizicola sp.]
MDIRQSVVALGAALLVASGAAMADVTASSKGGPGVDIAGEMTALFGTERQSLKRLPEVRLDAIANGPKKKSKAVPEGFGYTDAWLFAQPAPTGGEDWQCLTTALYFEARGEGLQGQFAVAEVILNRAESPLYPGSICGVVNQRGGGGCQFSFVCDSTSDKMRDAAARDRAARVARVMLDGAPRLLTDGATHFHTRSVRPGWARRFPQTAAIGAHVFYRHPSVNG